MWRYNTAPKYIRCLFNIPSSGGVWQKYLYAKHCPNSPWSTVYKVASLRVCQGSVLNKTRVFPLVDPIKNGLGRKNAQITRWQQQKVIHMGEREGLETHTYFICFTIVLFPDSPAPAMRKQMSRNWVINVKIIGLGEKTGEELWARAEIERGIGTLIGELYLDKGIQIDRANANWQTFVYLWFMILLFKYEKFFQRM